jgi:hypothetical protein
MRIEIDIDPDPDLNSVGRMCGTSVQPYQPALACFSRAA